MHWCRISGQSTQVYVVTTDQERAIQTGLRLSQMSDYSLHFFCGLHAKWNVRDHICSHGKKIFLTSFKNGDLAFCKTINIDGCAAKRRKLFFLKTSL